MSNVKESQSITTFMRGSVTGTWVNPATGERRPAFARRNQLSYAAADVMAQVLAGNTAYTPRYIGFIYGDSDSTPAGLSDPSLRTQTWDSLAVELGDGVKGNIQIAPITLTPTVVVDGDTSLYDGNSMVVTAHTETGGAGSYAFPTSAPYAGVLAAGSKLFHALLITKVMRNGVAVYIPVARVTLAEDGPVYLAKPEGFELAVDWQISFF